MKRVFVTHILSSELVEKYRISRAACNFSFNLIGGGIFDKVYSVLGTFIGGELESKAFDDSTYELVYNRFLRKKGKIGIKLAALTEQIYIYKRIEKDSIVWLYNITTLNILLYFLLRIFKRSVQINVIVLDYTPTSSIFDCSWIFLRVINSCHGNICLANSPLFTNTNSITLAGVVQNSAEVDVKIASPNNLFLLSGALYENICQLTMVLTAFSKLPNCELHITGKTDNEDLLIAYSKKYSNIYWYGNVSFEKYIELLHLCTFQLSTRDENYPENKCNFPSKIIEALLHNRIVISTMEYSQLREVRYFVVSSQLQEFKNQIYLISKKTDEVLLTYSNQGTIVSDMFNTNKWKEAMTKIEMYR